MIFAKRYENLVFDPETHQIKDVICGEVDYRIRQKLVGVMERFSQPITLPCSRYDKDDTEDTDAFTYACEQFNDIMECPYIQGSNLAAYCLSFIFSVIELQYENLYDHQDEDCDPLFPYVIHEKQEYETALNEFFSEYDLQWRILEGRMIKIDAQQFECDLKAKALEQMHELKDAEPKFQSAYTELASAIEALGKGDYQATISNAGKSYESVLKVILSANRGNADKLTNEYMNQFLTVPDTMKAEGFREKVMMSLPYVRNNSGADHGAGAQEVVISKPMAKLAVNLAAALETYLIEEYAARMTETES